jgi:hypothetical protein
MFNFFKKESPESLRAKQLFEARMALLEGQCHLEHWQLAVGMYKLRVDRLEREIIRDFDKLTEVKED